MKAQSLLVYLPDTRGVTIARFGRGNNKIGASVYTYSRKAGAAHTSFSNFGTCPGATRECEAICYAKRIDGPVKQVYVLNSGDDVPELPADCRLLRIHISGDFNTEEYICEWIARLQERPDVITWAYTRSWRVRTLLPHLERLRALPNVQLFASMDPSTPELPPRGWRRAWLDRDFDTAIKGPWGMEERLTPMCAVREQLGGASILHISDRNQRVITDGAVSYVCPEETGHQPNCEACGYCFRGRRGDVTFLEHQP